MCPLSRTQPVTQNLSYVLTQYLVTIQPVLSPTYVGVFHVKTLVLSPVLPLYLTYQVASLCQGHLKSSICWLLSEQCCLTYILCNVQKLLLTLITISLVLQTTSMHLGSFCYLRYLTRLVSGGLHLVSFLSRTRTGMRIGSPV